MRRVVVTGLGIVSSIGNDAGEVRASLEEGASGNVDSPSYKQYGLPCQVEGAFKLYLEEALDRKTRRFMGDGAPDVVGSRLASVLSGPTHMIRP